tara:strand:+ start:4886 stop:5209 length:324 start_codon:yes stop_codon:yes gene_type:complete
MRLTAKQIEILNIVSRGDGAGQWLDMGQIHERLSYECKRQALQCSIRFLVKKGLLTKLDCETRRERNRRVIAATVLGMQVMGRDLYKHVGRAPGPHQEKTDASISDQ